MHLYKKDMEATVSCTDPQKLVKGVHITPKSRLVGSSRLKARCKQAVKDFWEDERERLMHHQPSTRKKTKEQRDAILAGQSPKHNVKTIQGHHTYSVHLAGKSAIIYPATFNEHLNGWHGGNFKNSAPGRPIKNIRDF